MKELNTFRKYLAEGEIREDNILSFLKQNKTDLIDNLSQEFQFDEDDKEEYSGMDIEIGGDSTGELDNAIAGFGEAGLDFSFDKSKVEDTFGDASNFTLEIGGKKIYGIAYNV